MQLSLQIIVKKKAKEEQLFRTRINKSNKQQTTQTLATRREGERKGKENGGK